MYVCMTGGGYMNLKVKRITVVDESNGLGDIWIERLIERCLLEELGLSAPLQAKVLNDRYQFKDEVKDEEKTD